MFRSMFLLCCSFSPAYAIPKRKKQSKTPERLQMRHPRTPDAARGDNGSVMWRKDLTEPTGPQPQQKRAVAADQSHGECVLPSSWLAQPARLHKRVVNRRSPKARGQPTDQSTTLTTCALSADLLRSLVASQCAPLLPSSPAPPGISASPMPSILTLPR